MKNSIINYLETDSYVLIEILNKFLTKREKILFILNKHFFNDWPLLLEFNDEGFVLADSDFLTAYFEDADLATEIDHKRYILLDAISDDINMIKQDIDNYLNNYEENNLKYIQSLFINSREPYLH